MKFSVVIVNYADSWDLISRCVESLKQTKYDDFEVIVPDNDPASPAPEKVPADIRIIPNGRNLGFARAVNRGVSISGGEFVVLVNPDSTVDHEFFDGMERFFSENPAVGIVGPRIVDSDGTLQLSARREISFVSGLFGRTSLLTKLLPQSRFVKDQFPVASDAPTAVDWVSGACMVIRRETLAEIGLLDERFFMYFEDADLCRRAREAGYHIAYVPNIEVVHEAGGSTRDSTRAILDLHRSAFLYHRKHGRHGPANVVSGIVLSGLGVRAGAKWISSRTKPVE